MLTSARKDINGLRNHDTLVVGVKTGRHVCRPSKFAAICLIGMAAMPQNHVAAAEFYAYYTRVSAGAAFDRYSRTDDYADIVVKLHAPEGRLVFWRGTSYLPYWETAAGKWPLQEIVARSGDGSAVMPDRTNAYSHVEIIENTPSKAVIHWRYLSHFASGNPHRELDTANFVDEVFAVTPDGTISRVVKQGTPTIDEWKDPLYQTTQVLKLGPHGITEVSRKNPAHSSMIEPVKGNPEKGPPVGSPCVWFKFDEAQGDHAVEAVAKTNVTIPGHKTLWKRGVSGTALEFDGYHTVVTLPEAKAAVLQGGSLTLEGWFALGAYPWNWAPIVQQGDDDGYFLGVDGHGYPGFMVKVGGVWEKLSVPSSPPYADANHLALFRWYHLAGTYGKDDGIMRLYLNGSEIANRKVGTGGLQTAKADIRIGKAGIPRITTEDLAGGPTAYGLDGLIDDVRIYDTALGADQVGESFSKYDPGAAITDHPDMQPRTLPNPPLDRRFQAAYTTLPYFESWDNLWRFGNHADVVVGFDLLPIRYVFWHGVSYIPMIVNEANQWFCNEFNETGFQPQAPGDCEPMSDKACWSSHVRVLENTPARVVVHWRYRLINPEHGWAYCNAATGWGDIADWYYYIYPDGVAAKRMRCYSSDPDKWHEWDEQMAILGEGQHPEKVIRRVPVMTLVDAAGQATSYDWNPDPPRPDYRNKVIQMIHFTGRFNPFAIQRFDGGDVYSATRTWYSVFPAWNHWPTAQVNSSGRNALFPDRAAHSSISHLFWPLSRQQRGDVPFQEKVLLEGMTDQQAGTLADLAKSWLQAPMLEPVADCLSSGYDAGQRAYVLCATGPAPSFRIAASPEHPLVNPCFVVKDWNGDATARLAINAKDEPASPLVRQGIVRDPDGRRMLVVWMQRQASEPVSIVVRGARPEASLQRLSAMTWATPPNVVRETFDVTMAAAPLAGVGNEYRFEINGRVTGWQTMPEYTEFGLPPETEIACRVKGRNAYLAETVWSPVSRIKAPAAPAPVVWTLDEGQGAVIKDSKGGHEGSIHGKVSWVPGVARKALHLDGNSFVELNPANDLSSRGGFSWLAWIRTTQGGTILARASAGKQYQPGGKAMFVRDGRLQFDVGFVGAAGAGAPVADGQWHHVAVTVSSRSDGDNVLCYVDGRPSGSGRLDVGANKEDGLPIRIGFCNDDFPQGRSGFVGDLDEIGWYHYVLSAADIGKICHSAKPQGMK